MCEGNPRTATKAEEVITGPIMTGGYFDYNLFSAFLFSLKSYPSPGMRDSVKHIFTRLKLIEFMIETYESYSSKKQFPMDDLITYTVEHLSNNKKEVRIRA